METVTDFIFLGSKISMDGGCSHEIKRCLHLGRKAMTNLDSILKSRDTLLTKVHIVKAMVFPVVMYGCESWTIKKAGCWRIGDFKLWCWRRLLRVPWAEKRSVNLKGNQLWIVTVRTDTEAEAPMLWSPDVKRDALEKTLMLEKIEGRKRRWWQRMRWLDGITDSVDMSSTQRTLGGKGQGSLGCYSPWSHKESDTT